MAKVKETDLALQADKEVWEEANESAKAVLKQRQRELRSMKRAVKEAEKQFDVLMNMEVEDVAAMVVGPRDFR